MATTDTLADAHRLRAQADRHTAAAAHYRERSTPYFEAMASNPPKAAAEILPPGWSSAGKLTQARVEVQGERDARAGGPEAVALADSFDDHLDGCEPIDPPLLGGFAVMTPRQLEKHARRQAARLS